MSSPISRRRLGVLAGLGLLAATATACSNSDPLASGTPAASGTLVVGSQQYYSNEIIAELYAQSLEKAGFTVQRQYQIGQREVYLPDLAAGKIDVIPEYGGNLLQYYDKNTTAKDAAAIQSALASALPQGLRALEHAAATDQDSYTVTKQFSDQHRLTSLADLSKVTDPLKIAANSEFAKRPYGPDGLKSAYGATVTLVPVEDSGGPLTVKALKDGTTQLADIYTADPSITRENLVVLDDPKHLILPQNVTPIVSAKVNDAAADAINKVNAQLSLEDLRALNSASVNEQKKSADIASAWLKQKGLA
ncbi:ABC transporter substrate-binding protein [Nigerium sp.]|uniref:ABC transporter substrate-binding protein n=1 Tax=Nigerium sp. TaxID=2042655 RepID=UPI00322150FA